MAVSVPDRDEWFHDDHGIPQPRWEAIAEWIERSISPADREIAWQECTRHWLNRLRVRLGEDYAAVESQNFHLLSNEPEAARSKMIKFLEQLRSHITGVVGATESPEAHGKHVVLRFAEIDEYFAYVSHFYPDGEFASTAGMFITSGGYDHVAFAQSWDAAAERQILVHELAHNFLSHLPLPAWLNEALAMAFETDLGSVAFPPLTSEVATRHRDYWSEATIQEFWSGRAFEDIEGQELAYGLSRILLNLIQTEVRPATGELRRFVENARWEDAGASAASEHLGIELEDLAAAFLGPGDWRPKPKISGANPDEAGQPKHGVREMLRLRSSWR